MKVRKLFLYLHLVVGLVAALVLLALGVTGAVLVFGKELDHSLNARLVRVHPEGARLSLNALAAKLEQTHSGTKVSSITLPEGDDLAFNITLRPVGEGHSFNLAVNPYTADELGSLNGANTFIPTVAQFHKRLLLGAPGKLLVGYSSVMLLVLAVSGLVLWWPRKILTLDREKVSRRTSFNLHNFIGFYSSLFMLVFGFTGAVIHWEDEATDLVNHLAGDTKAPPVPQPSEPIPGAVPVSADQALALALSEVPGARVTSIQGLGLTKPIRITMKYSEDATPAGRSYVFLDPRTGQVLARQPSRTATLGFRMVRLWNRQIHTGDILGWPTRLLACATSLALPILAITGPLIWLGRMRARRRGENVPAMID